MSKIQPQRNTPLPAGATVAEPSMVLTAAELLGGSAAIRRAASCAIDLHELLLNGLPCTALSHLLRNTIELRRTDVLNTVGIHARSWQRRRYRPRARLTIEQGCRTWRLAELLATATHVFGDQGTAEQWLSSPAFALDGLRPINLMSTSVGAGLVEQLLGRIEHGIPS